MKSLNFLFALAILTTLLIALSSALQTKDDNEINAQKTQELSDSNKYQYGGPSRFFHAKKRPSYYQPRAPLTCDRYPRVCHMKGSPGHDCCRKRCVNTKTDRLNCGMCGLKCRYPEISFKRNHIELLSPLFLLLFAPPIVETKTLLHCLCVLLKKEKLCLSFGENEPTYKVETERDPIVHRESSSSTLLQ